MSKGVFLPAAVLVAFVSTVPAGAQDLARGGLDHAALAHRIIQSLGLEQGERVLLIGHPQFAADLVRPLRLEITRQGGTALGVLEVLSHPWPPGETEAANRARAALRTMFNQVDAAVMLPGATSDHPEYLAIHDILAEGRRRVIHFHWDANGSVMTLPGQPAPPAREVDRVYQRAVLEVDTDALRRHQEAFIDAMRTGEIRVTTPEGTDLRFRIGDRPVNRQDGDASAARMAGARLQIDREIELPAGVIRVAPLEETVRGVIVFPMSSWDGRTVRDLRLTLRNGRVVGVTAAAGAEAARAELARAHPDTAGLREFGLGFNPLLAVPDTTPWIPYYGYGAGVVRLSVGGNRDLGGRLAADYGRWNFFANASVWVDREAWVTAGHLRPMRP